MHHLIRVLVPIGALLAATDAERANPRKIADDLRAGVVRFVKKPAVAMSLAGLGALVLALVVRRIRRR